MCLSLASEPPNTAVIIGVVVAVVIVILLLILAVFSIVFVDTRRKDTSESQRGQERMNEGIV